MAVTINDVKQAVDILFGDAEHIEEAFSIRAFQDELERAIAYVNDGGSIDYEYFNRILISCHLGPVDHSIFNRYFPLGINSSEKLREGVQKFVKV